MTKISETGLTPLMEQYFSLKKQCEGAILLFRMGDFYETFGDDAVITARDLNITLTSRQRDEDGNKIPLAGIPYHALDAYLSRLVGKGHKVAICEQMEDPKLAKGLVKREITRIITPGTVIEPALLKEPANNYLASVIIEGVSAGLALVDVSTGEFLAGEVPLDRLPSEMARFSPAECLVPLSTTLGVAPSSGSPNSRAASAYGSAGDCLQPVDDSAFDPVSSLNALLSRFGPLEWTDSRPLATRAAGAVLAYLHSTRLDAIGHITTIRLYQASDYMVLDDVTLRNLEIFKNIRDGSRKGTLVEFLDRTETATGSRTLSRWLQMPSLSPQLIKMRHAAVEELAGDAVLRGELSSELSGLGDLERLTGRAACGSASPKDMASMRFALSRLPAIRSTLEAAGSPLLREISERLDPDALADLAGLLQRSLVDDPPASPKDGGIIRDGYDAELDSLRSALSDGKGWIVRMEAEERRRTGIKSLKVSFNNVFGYYIEVTRPNLSLVPADYIRKQTLANAERFVTPELKRMEEKVVLAEERSRSLEYKIFVSLREAATSRAPDIQRRAAAVGEIDALAALATAARESGMVRPELNPNGELILRDSKHPVMDRLMRGRFVPNDVHLDMEDNRFMILTGPNMAGKSTFMRQIAIAAIMAQTGSFVPAGYASLPIIDRIFTRVGARDDLIYGQSTFMVEMTELANILSAATHNSLILLDEIGRGTSTFDGLSIAWAVTEHIHTKIRAKTIFATHYHQLTQLALSLKGVVNYNIAVREEGGSITFLRTVVPGATDKSYGIHVARLAGIPDIVVKRAQEVLREIERRAAIEINSSGGRSISSKSVEAKTRYTQLIFFDAPAASGIVEPPRDPLLDEIRDLDLDSMTPLQALSTLAEFKSRLDRGRPLKREEHPDNRDDSHSERAEDAIENGIMKRSHTGESRSP